MSTNCLISKLKSEFQDENLDYLGFFRVKATASSDAGFAIYTDNKEVTIKSDEPFSVYVLGNSSRGELLAADVYNYTGATYSKFYIAVPGGGNAHTYFISKYQGVKVIGTKFPYTQNMGSSIEIGSNSLKFQNPINRIEEVKFIGDFDWGSSQITDFTTTVYSLGNVEAFFINSPNLQKFRIVGESNKGLSLDFDNLDGTVGMNLTDFQFWNNKNVKGDVLEWANRLWSNGKTSGSMIIQGVGSNATLGEYSWGMESKTLTFNVDGVVVS